MIRVYPCEKGCCSIKVRICKPQGFKRRRRGNCRKAGVFIYDPEEERILLVQSRGQLWGPPKGTLEVERDETSVECAIREVKEETGLDVKVEDFTRATKIKNRAMYYYVERKTCDVEVQEHENEEANDANGITWIKLDCLQDCILAGKIVLNQHCKAVFKRFMNRVYRSSDFVKVEHRRRRAKT
uniref:Nudix hydrolase domain-containing protein n=1 Tax=viral metagenome TaxID=1070528 RepID=A0A6C0EPU4_9ZZZZ